MDFIEARHAAAREIALALGVPPMLLAIPGDNTYSNYQEATRAFWRQTVLPLANRIASALTTWLAQSYNPALSIRPDLDQVEALSGERAELWTRLNATAFLTPNEKRQAAGYDLLAQGGDTVTSKFNSLHDALGRFDFKPEDDDPLFQQVSRRRGGNQGTPAQEAQLAAATARARQSERRVRELDPEWRSPTSLTSNIQGEIAAMEARAAAAEARVVELTRGAIPGTNPAWGSNRLRDELYSRGYRLEGETEGAGLQYRNQAGDVVRIMERPDHRWRSDPDAKHIFDYYYRYKPNNGPWGAHTPIPNK